jgi:UDP-N-acetylmuramate dehydrogenase
MSVRYQSEFFGDIDADVEFDAQLGTMTYYAIGGTADVLIKPRSTDALSILLRRCYNSNVPCRILGKGANLLIDDIGVDGVVVQLEHECFKTCTFNREGPIDAVHIMGGADLSKTLMETARCGLWGLHVMAGIPASIGGAIRMNAGGTYGSITDTLSTVTCLTKGGELVTYRATDLEFGYRESKIPDPIIVSATFDLTPGDPITIRQAVKEIFAWKKSRQPLADSSAGCAFKNPMNQDGERISAGKLIDEAGLKGFAIGGATVSSQHANFIISTAKATAQDVLNIMEEVRHQVHDKTGIELQKEVVIWSRDSEAQR